MGKQRFKGERAYKLLTPLMRILFNIYYHPTILNQEYIPKEGPILIVGNHKHIYDQCLTIMATKRVIHYLAKKEYFDGKMAWFFKLVGCIPIDRSRKNKKSTDYAIEILRNSGAIGLFPEGTRNKTTDQLLLPFKMGTVSMAKKTNATIVPFAITGNYKFRGKSLTIRYGEPFQINNMSLEEANEKLYQEIKSLLLQKK
ncbi:MAG: 1-acyl-sn-glycerol-3-phosphate acyltransferase [Bacilli bacterium]|nr:1-acyl-sn-glycerol-3-phosphate acyltransferase [Bacilli bacterium]